MKSSALVGVSLDSSMFTREWLQFALHHILSQHESALFVLADQILLYNKLASLKVKGELDFESAFVKITQRRNDIARFLQKEVNLLPKSDQIRVRIANWGDYSDTEYANILRSLHVAYATVPEFRSCVELDVSRHMPPDTFMPYEQAAELSSFYVLDETAMDIRITELSPFHVEYYPEVHIQTLTSLYAGRFADRGLSIPKLTQQSPKRVFVPLEQGYVPPAEHSAMATAEV